MCPHCKQIIAWYDNIPVLSWVLLRAQCRQCKKPISILYPFIELFTGLMLTTLLVRVPFYYFPAYFIFFSALIVSIRTDLETMLISRYMSLFLIPVGLFCAWYQLIPLSFFDSCCGALFGYWVLWGIAWIFYMITGKDGMGQGDIELLGLIGSFTGIAGAWISLFLGSVAGTIAGTIHMLATGERKIPFGPFLALGAMSYVLLKEQLIHFFFIF